MRQSLKRCRRCASSLAATARKPPEYKLPPLPTPLDPKRVTPYNQFNLFPSAAASEQRTVLEACIAGGHIVRAKNIWTRIKRLHQQETEAGSKLPSDLAAFDTYGTLSDLIPMSVHASFLRAFFRDALAGKRFSGMEQSVDDAWEWWQMLLEQQHQVGRPDAECFAVMIKGALTTAEPREDGSLPSHRELLDLIALLPQYDLTLARVLDEPIFDSQATAALGSLKPEEVLSQLQTIVKESPDASSAVQTIVAEAEESFSEKPESQRIESVRVDPLEGVPALEPTYRPTPGSEAPELEQETSVPIRLDALRGHLASLTSKRQVAHSEPIRRQRELEESAYDAARKQFERERELARDRAPQTGNSVKTMRVLMWEWTTLLAAKIQERRDAVVDDSTWVTDGASPTYTDNQQFLWSVIEPEQLAFLTISELLTSSNVGPVADGATLAILCNKVGRAIEREHRAQVISHADKKAFQRKMQYASGERGGQSGALDRMWRAEMVKMRTESRAAPPEWTAAMKVKLAASLLAMLIDVAKVQRTVKVTNARTGEQEEHTELQPAFYHTYQYVQGQKLGIIKCNQAILERLEVDPMAAVLHPRQLPMVIPPRMWQDRRTGCYILLRADVMRIKHAPEQRAQLERADLQGDLVDVYAALDYLGSTPWQINRRVYDIVAEVWNSGEAIADLPMKSPLLNMPDPVAPVGVNDDLAVKVRYQKAKRAVARNRGSQHSQRCAINYKLEIARAYLGETLYFPHNVDFRGRAYPIPPNLSHIGDDLSRGLLQFAEAKPLGEKGLYWLKVHLANLYGFDKASIADRQLFAEEHMDDIFDSADRPLEGKRWWLQAEDPWQCLATCLDLAAAIRSPDPTKYASRQPVHQDGTCNGLQHYAALGGDPDGAAAVNLVAGEKPSDVYGRVAAAVSEVVDRDAANGHDLAKRLQGKIGRKLVKQTVMTTVYGVTFIGANRMIVKQLQEQKLVEPEVLFQCGLYLTRLTLASIGDIFKRARAIQRWLSQCAKLVCRSLPPTRLTGAAGEDTTKMVPMVWTTPLKLPVTQPYRLAKRRQVSTVLQSIALDDPHTVNEVDTRSQATAFPPNYIHSLDATHMMLTAMECKKEGIVFASVHDSFWTHPCDVDVMSAMLRKSFIELHTQPLLEKLRADMLYRYKDFRVFWSDLPEPMLESLGLVASADAAQPKKRRGRGKGKKTLEAEAEQAEQAQAKDEAPFASTGDLDMADLDVASLRPLARKAVTMSDSMLGRTVLLSDILPPVPKRGPFDVSNVSESMYFFS